MENYVKKKKKKLIISIVNTLTIICIILLPLTAIAAIWNINPTNISNFMWKLFFTLDIIIVINFAIVYILDNGGT